MIVSVQLNSVTQWCPTVCNPVDCSTARLPCLSPTPKFPQTYVHQIGDAIQPSYPRSSPSPPAFPSIRVFSSESVLPIRWPNYWSFSFSICPSNGYSEQISFRTDWWSPCNPRGSPTPQLKSINSSALSFLSGPTFTLIHDYWKNHSFD